MTSTFSFRLFVVLSLLAFFRPAYGQVEIGDIKEVSPISGINFKNLKVCKPGSLFFDAECRDRAFFESLLPDSSTLVDAEGCNPPISMKGQDPDCGHTVDLIEKASGTSGEETRYVKIIAVKPPREIAAVSRITGVRGASSEPKGIGYTRSIRPFEVAVRGKRVLEGELQPAEIAELDLDMAPFRGPYQVISYKADEIDAISGGYRHITDFRVYGADRKILNHSVQDIEFTKSGIEEYDVSGKICSSNPEDFQSHLVDAFANVDPAPLDCTCLESRCFDPMEDGRARDLPKGKGTSVECIGDVCNVCSITHTDDVIETELRYSRIFDRVGRRLPSGQYSFDRISTDCFDVNGRHLNSYYRAFGSTPDGPTCDTSVFLDSNSSLCTGIAGTFAAALAAGEIVTQMGFKGSGAVTFSGGSDTSAKLNLSLQFSSLNNRDYSLQNAANTALENFTSWNAWTQSNMCSADSSLNLEMADSVCQGIQGNATCDGQHTARISFMEDGKSYSAMAELECYSTSSNSSTKLGDSDCQCEVKWFLPG